MGRVARRAAERSGSALEIMHMFGKRVAALWRGTVAVLHQLTGEGAYGAYCAHRSRTHPGEPVMGEREFWREHYAAQDRDPGARCC